MTPQSTNQEPQVPPRVWANKHFREGWVGPLEHRIDEKFFRHNYAGNMIEYLSVLESNKLVAAAREEERIAVLKEINEEVSVEMPDFSRWFFEMKERRKKAKEARGT